MKRNRRHHTKKNNTLTATKENDDVNNKRIKSSKKRNNGRLQEQENEQQNEECNISYDWAEDEIVCETANETYYESIALNVVSNSSNAASSPRKQQQL